ncbi:hypothetical protein [Aurantiacibacter sediminis]|uniref:Uncharacterized protein n=1 Tax=Aurantiacibacter sediminis TaxID=2793064 RepID=A0ABS0N4N5_9SPHN|nr:hypothetical protein [Aurantiacibacter sediminis]MBH5322229.1 hypothetical protein [Aurantiacibacter sediminis]
MTNTLWYLGLFVLLPFLINFWAGNREDAIGTTIFAISLLGTAIIGILMFYTATQSASEQKLIGYVGAVLPMLACLIGFNFNSLANAVRNGF